MPQMTNTQESTDPIARLESDMLRFVPSRGWEIKVVTFPATPYADVVIPHGLTVDAPEAVQYQVLQTNCPQTIFHDPTTTWTHSEIRLRSTVASGQAVILLTTGKATQPRLDYMASGTIRFGAVQTTGTFSAAPVPDKPRLWQFSTTTATVWGDRVVHTIDASEGSITFASTQTKTPTGSGSLTLGLAAPTTAGARVVGSAGLTFGSSTGSTSYNRFFAHQLSLQTITATITANQNDYSPTGWPTAGVLLINASGADRTLTGLDSSKAYTNWDKTGRTVFVQNNSATYTLTLNHAHVSSSTENRFNLPYGEDIVLGPGEGVNLIHNGSNWGLFGKGHAFAKAIAPKAGIQFPAVQVASTGANVLDDYEEGTWTPVIGGNGGTSGQTYARQQGHYRKIGNFVFVRFEAILTAKGTITGNAQIQGLPFTTASSFTGESINFINFNDLATSQSGVRIATGGGVTGATLAAVAAGGGTNSNTVLTTADILNSTSFAGMFAYIAED